MKREEIEALVQTHVGYAIFRTSIDWFPVGGVMIQASRRSSTKEAVRLGFRRSGVPARVDFDIVCQSACREEGPQISVSMADFKVSAATTGTAAAVASLLNPTLSDMMRVLDSSIERAVSELLPDDSHARPAFSVTSSGDVTFGNTVNCAP